MQIRSVYVRFLILITIVVFLGTALAGQWPKEIHVYKGKTPVLDGVLSKGEYDDAVAFNSRNWNPTFNPVTDENDSFLEGWVKHDGENLYFAFRVHDDKLYGIDIPRWVPEEFPHVHELSRRGFPWFGDGIEILINASYEWSQKDNQENQGTPRAWQMVCNATKSRLGGVGKGGLMEGEPRVLLNAWNTYQRWILNGDMKAEVTLHAEKHYFVIEWMIKADPCLEVEPGITWTPSLGVAPMGLNIAVQDADTPEEGEGNFGNFDHENWWSGEGFKRTWLKQFGTMFMHPGEKPREIHIGPGGSDDNPATAKAPVRSLAGVKRVLASIAEQQKEADVLVILHPGLYTVHEPIEIAPEMFGTNMKVTVRPYPGYEWDGNRALISGGVEIKGWKLDRAKGMYKAKVPDVLNKKGFRQLFMDGMRLTRAKYPNDMNQNFTIATASDDQKRFTLKESLGGKDVTGAEMVSLHHWSIARGIVDELRGDTIVTQTPMGWTGTPWFCLTNPKDRVFFENKLSFLDQAGEWYYDAGEGMVYVKLQEQENPSNHTFMAAGVDQLVVLKGRKDEPVENVRFEYIDFAYAGWSLPDGGYAGLQAAYTGTGYKTEPTYGLPLTVHLEYAKNCAFRLCRFRHFGANGLGMTAGCRNNEVAGCEFDDIGANAVMVGWRDKADTGPRKWFENDWDDPDDAPAFNSVNNCYVHDCGTISYGAIGIFVAFSPDTKIRHNLVTRMPYSGMSIGFRWDTDWTTQERCLVEYNHVFDVMNVLADGGAVYLLGLQEGTVINNNLLHAVNRAEFTHGSHNNGIFFDEGSKGYLVSNNIIYDTDHEPIRFNQSKKETHEWDNNYFGVNPKQVCFPWDRAAVAGVEPAYRCKVLGCEKK